MLKDPRTAQNVAEWVVEFQQDVDFSEIERPSLPRTHEDTWNKAFLQLLSKVVDKFLTPQPVEKEIIVDEITMDNYEIQTVNSIIDEKKKDVFVEPRTFVDIYVNVVDNVLLSTLLLHKNEPLPPSTFSYALFKIYQRYPDTLIRSVVNKLQKNNIMAKNKIKKNDPTSLKRGLTPYKLSHHYNFLLQTKFVISDITPDFKEIPTVEDNSNRNEVALMTSLFAAGNQKFVIDIPDNFVVIESKSDPTDTKTTPFFDDPRNSSRSLLAFRQHLSNSISNAHSDINKNLQDILVLAKCKISCFPVEHNYFNEKLFSAHLNYLNKPLLNEESSGKLSETFEQLADFIANKKELGATESDVIDAGCGWKEKDIKALEDKDIICRVGVAQFRWVHKKCLQPWIVNSVTDSKQKETVIRYIAKCWKRPNGEVDNKTLFSFMSAINGHVMSFPGVKEEAIVAHFRIVMPAVQVLEMIELLLVVKCLELTEISVPSKPVLFKSSSSEVKVKFYETTPDSLIVLSQVRKFLEA